MGGFPGCTMLEFRVFSPPVHFYIHILKILSEKRVSIIIIIYTRIYHFFYRKKSVETKKRLIILPTLKQCLKLPVQIINIKSTIAMSEINGSRCAGVEAKF